MQVKIANEAGGGSVLSIISGAEAIRKKECLFMNSTTYTLRQRIHFPIIPERIKNFGIIIKNI